MSNSSINSRRVFLRTGIAATALGGAALAQTTGGTGGTGTGGTGNLPAAPERNGRNDHARTPREVLLNVGDNAILRFSLAAEMIAADIWSQIADQIANDTISSQEPRQPRPSLPR